MTLDEELQALVRNAVDSEPAPARDPVNQPMIRHWCDAIGDANPIYTDPTAAAASVHGEIVAPPTMLQAWTMPGLGRRRPFTGGPDPLALLDAAGYTSVVATDCEQDYKRYLKLGDALRVTSRLESISTEKRTGLGPGYFVTNLLTYRDQHGEIVAEMRFRILKFRPAAAAVS
jgi:uncharacterized protein